MASKRVRDLRLGSRISVTGYRLNEDPYTVAGKVVREPSVDNRYVGDCVLIETRSGAWLCVYEEADGSCVKVTRRRGTGRSTCLHGGELEELS